MPKTVEDAIQDVKQVVSAIGAHSPGAIARGYVNTLSVNEAWIRDNFDNEGWHLNRDRQTRLDRGLQQNVLIKLNSPALFGTQYAQNHLNLRVYPVSCFVYSDLTGKMYLIYAFPDHIDIRKVQCPWLCRSLGFLRGFPIIKDRNVLFNVLYFHILQLLHRSYHLCTRYALVLHNVYHFVYEGTQDGKIIFLQEFSGRRRS